MAFWGKSFTFNGVPCEDFGLMLYDIGEHRNSSGSFASTSTIVEDKTAKRCKPIFYGVKHDNKLEFSLVFGVNPNRLESHHHLDRGELDAIASWLTGHNEYHWLEFDQDDMMGIRYRAMITSLKVVEYGMLPWAFEATVVCDCPYAYQYPKVFEYDVEPGDKITFYNESSRNDYFYPKIELDIFDDFVYATPSTVRVTKNYYFSCLDAEINCKNRDGEIVKIRGGHYINNSEVVDIYNQIDLFKDKYFSSDDAIVDHRDYSGIPGGLCYSTSSMELSSKDINIAVQCETLFEEVFYDGTRYELVSGHLVDLNDINNTIQNQIEHYGKLYNATSISTLGDTTFTGMMGSLNVIQREDGTEEVSVVPGHGCNSHNIILRIEYMRFIIDGHEFDNTSLDEFSTFYFYAEADSDVVGAIVVSGNEYIICDRNGEIPSHEDRSKLFNAGQSVCVQLDKKAGKALVLGTNDNLPVGEVYYGDLCLDDSGADGYTPHNIEHTATYTFISLSEAVLADSLVKFVAPCNNCAGVLASLVLNDINQGEKIEFWWADKYEFNTGDILHVKLDETTRTVSIIRKIDAETISHKFSVVNTTDNNRIFELNGSELIGKTVVVDNDLGIISANGVINPYQYFNFNFLRLLKGYNTLEFDGYGKIKIICEFPVNVGG